ncbi:MAG: hypothetical protein LBK73_00690 [Treponema sp.]|nr:hypothetical protein [Treponema sp.]
MYRIDGARMNVRHYTPLRIKLKRIWRILCIIRKGMNIARFNFSCGSHEEHGENASLWCGGTRSPKGAPAALMLDAKRPEIRMGVVKKEEALRHALTPPPVFLTAMFQSHSQPPDAPLFALFRVTPEPAVVLRFLATDGSMAFRFVKYTWYLWCKETPV